MASADQPALKKSLTLTGVTVNAMALIAPGAFLWLTYQLQAAQVDAHGVTTAPAMWAGIVLALILAFLTAISYSKLAELYPDAGTGSSYYFAERAFLDRQSTTLKQWARLSKFSTGWITHLYYWVYPGVMVAMLATLVAYIAGQFGFTIPAAGQAAIAVLLALSVGAVAYRGINGSTTSAIVINVIQIVTLVGVTVLTLIFRATNPDHVKFLYPSAMNIIWPGNLSHILFQSTIAILLLVGFESATALAAESQSPKHVSRGVILSLVIQGLVMYLFEYLGANLWINSSYALKDASSKVVTGFAAAAASSAPIGDMVKILGDRLLGGIGFPLMVGVAASVAIAVFGSALACLNTGVRITYAMGRDAEAPTVLGLLHQEHATPHVGVIALTIASAVIGAFGVLSLRNLLAVTLLSNIGTFLTYGITNLVALFALRGAKGNPVVKVVVPLLGLIANVGMLLAVLYLGILGGGDTKIASLWAIIGAGVWLVLGSYYFLGNSAQRMRPVFDHNA